MDRKRKRAELSKAWGVAEWLHRTGLEHPDAFESGSNGHMQCRMEDNNTTGRRRRICVVDGDVAVHIDARAIRRRVVRLSLRARWRETAARIIRVGYSYYGHTPPATTGEFSVLRRQFARDIEGCYLLGQNPLPNFQRNGLVTAFFSVNPEEKEMVRRHPASCRFRRRVRKDMKVIGGRLPGAIIIA